MHLRTLFVSMILVAGCGSSKEGGGDKPAKEKSGRPTNKDVTSLFTGSAPTLPAEVAKASFDAKKADVQKEVGTDSGYMSSKTHADVSYDLRFTKSDNLEQVSVTTRGTPLEPVLTKQWGPPTKTAKGELFWFSPEQSLRAWLPSYGKGEVVAFSRYEPLTALLGGKGFDLAFAKDKKLFGATLDELKTAFGGKLCDFDRQAEKMKQVYAENVKDSLARLELRDLSLSLCPAWSRTVEQYSPSKDTIYMGLDQKAYGIAMTFPTGGSVELAAQLVKQLDDKFGTATEIADEAAKSKERFYFDPAAKLRAVARINDDYVTLIVGPYLPFAELIGDASKPGLAIETANMLGGTIEQISAEDPEHIRHMGELHSLVYPPTEWSMNQTEIDLLRYAKQTKTYAYRTVLHHKTSDHAAPVLALLETKYGQAKKVTGDDKDKTYSFAGKRKVSARLVSNQWQLTFEK